MGRAMEHKLITMEDVAAALKCSRTTIWRKVKDGSLPAPVKVCGLTRWRAGDIAALIDNAPGAITKPIPRNRVRARAA